MAAAKKIGAAVEGPAGAIAETTQPEREQRGRRLVLAGAFAVAGGLGIAGTVRQDIGGMVVVAGWLLFIVGLHSFGRAASA